jgi:hypothetical protein
MAAKVDLKWNCLSNKNLKTTKRLRIRISRVVTSIQMRKTSEYPWLV